MDNHSTHSIDRSRGRFETQLKNLSIGDFKHTGGRVITRQGIVAVEQWLALESTDDELTLYFVYRGREHRLSLNKVYSTRYLITLADRFARDVAEGKYS